MVVGVVSWQLAIPGCRSLKEKRMVVRSLKDRIKSRFNVSIAETAHQDVWTRAELSVAAVGGDGAFVDSLLDRVDRFVVEDRRAQVVSTSRELY